MAGELDRIELAGIEARECREVLRRLDALAAKVASKRLSVIAAADRARVGQDAGFSGTGPWVAGVSRAPGAEAAAQVRLATELETTLPQTKQALADGAVSPAHARVIAQAMATLPEGLTPDQRATVEQALTDSARRLDPVQLRRRARRVLEHLPVPAEDVDAHEDERLRSEEDAALAKCRFTLRDNHDGTVTGHFTVPTLAGLMLKKIIQGMAGPRRQHPQGESSSSRPEASAQGAAADTAKADGGTDAADGGTAVADGGTAAAAAEDVPASFTRAALWNTDDWQLRYGLALVELLEHLPTDHLNARTAATVVVTMTKEQLLADLAAAGSDVGHDVSAREARRLACGAGIMPAVLGGPSVVLDLGRSQRFFSERQRTALATRYESCAAVGCDRPYAWTELHHEHPWARGGRTDLRDAVPLCGWHHRRIHDPSYVHRTSRGADQRAQVTFHARS